MRSDISEKASADVEAAANAGFKRRLQSFLGGLVIIAIPAIPGLGFLGWTFVNNLAGEHKQYVFQLASLAVRLEQDRSDFKERIGLLENNLSARLDRLDAWKEDRNKNQFRKSDGDTLSGRIEQATTQLFNRIDRLESQQNEHDRHAQKYIATIERNTPLIFSNQRKAHTHPRSVDYDP